MYLCFLQPIVCYTLFHSLPIISLKKLFDNAHLSYLLYIHVVTAILLNFFDEQHNLTTNIALIFRKMNLCIEDFSTIFTKVNFFPLFFCSLIIYILQVDTIAKGVPSNEFYAGRNRDAFEFRAVIKRTTIYNLNR